jgi:iron complex outermembrane receptor protein
VSAARTSAPSTSRCRACRRRSSTPACTTRSTASRSPWRHRQRSAYLGSIQDFQDNTQLAFIKAESQLDLQVSYEFQSGWLKGLSLLAQGSNLTNEPFTKYNAATGAVTETKKFGSSYLAGLNYKF